MRFFELKNFTDYNLLLFSQNIIDKCENLMSYYKNIFKNLPYSCILLEKKKDVFVIKEANTFYCKITHINGDELRGKMIEEVFPENPLSSGLKEIQESLEIAYTNQESHKIDVLRYDLYDGQNDIYKLKYREIENIPFFDKPKNTRYILNVVKDITAEILERDRGNINYQKQNEESLLG